ncbi:glycosyltransferase family 8 protein [Limosilactobacillus difficilis]|uniref:glycosyltransferase family 8 protein n=1 Tax=Limosilactobacillus difficilis TaxID=2991838 RepID=UPI0024B8994E|nr:glycosyltransferase family 8 protein [Limosilactobacillus difficilis]
MNLLFSIDESYIPHLATVLLSIHANTPQCHFDIYVISDQPLGDREQLARFCQQLGMNFHPIIVDPDDFTDAPVTERYPQTIYYRLLAHQYLPKNLERILYLDADVLCINDLRPLYQTDLRGYLYASAIHTNLTNTTEVINRIRLQNFESKGYYNSGVLLMNLAAIRQNVRANDIFDYIRNHVLLLPDQDVLNALYGERIKSVPDQLYNFDTRKLATYQTISFGEWNLDWVIKKTVILHYCGRDKPWQVNLNHGKFTALYKHYDHLTQLLLKQH